MTPNDTLSEDCELLVSADSLCGLMDLLDIEDLLNPVKVMFTNDGATVWAHDANKTIQAFIQDYELEKYNLKSEPTYLVLEPKRMRDLLKSKFSGKQVKITRPSGGAMTVESKTGGTTTIYPPDLDECLVVPDHWVLPMEKGWLKFPMLPDTPKAESRVSITGAELTKGITDMRVAGASYCVFSFDKKSEASSGHWATKETASTTPIEATLEGEPCSVAFPDLLGAVAGCYSNDETLVVFKHTATPFFVITNANDSVRLLVTEAQNEGAE